MITKKMFLEQILNESSNQDFLMFVIKYLSDDPEHWQNEWVYDGRYKQTSQCVCGKEGIETVYVVRNEVTNKILSPIGSVCIEHFSHNLLKQIKDDITQNFLDVLVRNNKNEEAILAMSKKFFKKEDLTKICNAGVITEEEKNICLKALGKRSATLDDFRKANDILMDKIVPAIRKSVNAAVASCGAHVDDIYFDKNIRRLFEDMYANFKSNKPNIDDFESIYGPDNDGNLFESAKTIRARKLELYNEFKIIDSTYRNFYEAKIAQKRDRKFLILENHLIRNKFNEKDYSSNPLEVNIFELNPDIENVDEVVAEDDFDNDFSDLPEPKKTFSNATDKCLKQFYDSL